MRLIFSWVALALLCGAMPEAADAAWHKARSKHFIIYADQPPEKIREFTVGLERFDQALRQVRRMPDPPLTESNLLTVFVVKDDYAIEKLAGGAGVVGFYIPRASGSVAFVPAKAGSTFDKWDLDAQAVFFHEYAHHLQLQSADVAMPPWVTEGFAEFFGRTQLRDDGSVVLGVPPAYRGFALNNYSDLSLEEMLGAETSLTYIESELIYGRGWLLTHYLTFNRSRRGQFDRYLDEIQKGTAPLSAARQAFGDLNKLTAELSRYLRQRQLPHLILGSAQLATGEVAITPLSPAAAEMMPVYMRSARGVTARTKRRVAADARKIAAKHPRDPFVQTALAQALFDADNFAEAQVAADAALSADPKNLSALIFKGRSQMELASKAPASADWTSIRAWFLKANKVDPEAAEPLVHFHKSFSYAGTAPTGNAVNGLLYALALAPQDSELRVAVVRQLLTDNRVDDARRYFAPFAYEAHFGRARRAATAKVMTAIKSAQPQQALAQLATLEKILADKD